MYGRKGKQIFSKTVRSSKLKWQRTLQINNAHLDRSRCCWQHLQEARLRSKRFRLISEQRKTEEGDFRFWPREKWNESQKMREGGGGGEGRKRLETNPLILKTCVRQRTQRLIGSASRTILTCVDQRFVSYWSGRFALQRKSIFFNFVWNAKLFLRLYKGFRSLNLFSNYLLDLNN